MKLFFLLGNLALVLTACSQQDSAEGFRPEVRYRQFVVGETVVPVRSFSFETATPYLFVLLHSDEMTAAEVAHAAAHRWGVDFVQLQNQQNRLVSFMFRGKTFLFDPNRIFSDRGIKNSLRLSGRYTDAAFGEVKQFSDSLLSLLPQNKTIVALHNNTDDRFTVHQYRDAGVGQVHVNEKQDVDDFFITNDEEYFQLLKAENFNVVLEEAGQMEDDGSLSLFCSRNRIRYINVEAQHGHRDEQEAMLVVVNRILK